MAEKVRVEKKKEICEEKRIDVLKPLVSGF